MREHGVHPAGATPADWSGTLFRLSTSAFRVECKVGVQCVPFKAGSLNFDGMAGAIGKGGQKEARADDERIGIHRMGEIGQRLPCRHNANL